MLKKFNNYILLNEIDSNPPLSDTGDPFMKELIKIEQALISMIEVQFKTIEQTLVGHVQTQMRINRPFTSKLRNWWRKTWNPNAPHDESFDASRIKIDLPENIMIELPNFISLQEEKVIEELLSIVNEGPIQDTAARMSAELQRLKSELIRNVMQAFQSIHQNYQSAAAQHSTPVPQAAAPQKKSSTPSDWADKLKSWQDTQHKPGDLPPMPDFDPRDFPLPNDKPSNSPPLPDDDDESLPPLPDDKPEEPQDEPASQVVPGRKPRGRKNKTDVLQGPNIGDEEPEDDQEIPDDQEVPDEKDAEEEPPAPPAPVRPKIGLGLGRNGPIEPFTRPGSKKGPIDPRVLQAFAPGGKPGVIPRELSSDPDNKPVKNYDPDSAADADPEHFNTGGADRTKMLGLWGPGAEAFYKKQKRDSNAKKDIYNFLSVLSRNKETRKYLDYMKKFPIPKVLNWVQAFPAQQQMEIASRLPFLDDGLNEEDPSVTKSFWDRVDKDSFYKAVEKTFGGRIKPDYELMSKYVEGNLRDRVKTLCELLRGPYQSVGNTMTPEGSFSERLEKYRKVLGS